MADPRAISNLVQARAKRILDLAELAVPTDKFERFRTLVLDELGHKGLQSDIAALLEGRARDGQAWHGPDTDGQERKRPMSG